MRKRINKKWIIVAAAAVVVALVTLISVTMGASGGVFTQGVETVTRPFKSVAASVVSQFESIYGYIYKYDSVVKENQQLKKQVADLEQERRDYTEVAEENERFRQLFELASRYSDYKFDTASIISWSSSNFSSSFTVSKGSENSEVEVGDSVITEAGALVGVITEVYEKTSVAVTVIDTKFSAGSLIEASGDTAVASGDYTLMRRGLLKLQFLSGDSQYYAGDAVVTSGSGGVYPQGLVIGHVATIEDNTSGVGHYATLEPAVSFGDTMDVFLITDFEFFE